MEFTVYLAFDSGMRGFVIDTLFGIVDMGGGGGC